MSAGDVGVVVREDGDAENGGDGGGGLELRHGGHVGEVDGGGVVDGLVGAGGVELADVSTVSQKMLA